jgi:GNAT superfamily N-acetyltransferase
MHPWEVVDALATARLAQAQAITVAYLAVTDHEAGLPMPQGFAELGPGLRDVVATLAARHQPPGALLLALVGEQVHGTVAMRRSTLSRPSDALVQRRYVPAPYRRLGVARLLMNAVHEASAQAGFTRTVLAVMPGRTGARAPYQSLGYLPSTDDVDWGWDAVGLCRDR